LLIYTGLDIKHVDIPVTVATALIDNVLVIWTDHGVDVVCAGGGQAGLCFAFAIRHVQFNVAIAAALEDHE